MAKYSALVMYAEAHVDRDLMNPNFIIKLSLGEKTITLNQNSENINGKSVEHTIEIESKAQAEALVQGLKAMGAALGWKL